MYAGLLRFFERAKKFTCRSDDPDTPCYPDDHSLSIFMTDSTDDILAQRIASFVEKIPSCPSLRQLGKPRLLEMSKKSPSMLQYYGVRIYDDDSDSYFFRCLVGACDANETLIKLTKSSTNNGTTHLKEIHGIQRRFSGRVLVQDQAISYPATTLHVNDPRSSHIFPRTNDNNTATELSELSTADAGDDDGTTTAATGHVKRRKIHHARMKEDHDRIMTEACLALDALEENLGDCFLPALDLLTQWNVAKAFLVIPPHQREKWIRWKVEQLQGTAMGTVSSNAAT